MRLSEMTNKPLIDDEKFREIDALFQSLWTKAVHTYGYNKKEWKQLQFIIRTLYRDKQLLNSCIGTTGSIPEHQRWWGRIWSDDNTHDLFGTPENNGVQIQVSGPGLYLTEKPDINKVTMIVNIHVAPWTFMWQILKPPGWRCEKLIEKSLNNNDSMT